LAGSNIRPRVLVLDDEPMVGDLLSRVLGDEMEVTVEQDAPRGLARLLAPEAERFDLVLCDLAMPVLNGPQLHGRLEAERPELASRLIFITGGAFDEDMEDFLDETPNEVIHKPFTADELRRAVRQALARG